MARCKKTAARRGMWWGRYSCKYHHSKVFVILMGFLCRVFSRVWMRGVCVLSTKFSITNTVGFARVSWTGGWFCWEHDFLYLTGDESIRV